jgi:hypothetical protein
MQMNTEIVPKGINFSTYFDKLSTDEIKRMLEEYPTFGSGHLILAFKEQKSSEAETLWHKALLYGGEKQWINFVYTQLNDTDTGSLQFENTESNFEEELSIERDIETDNGQLVVLSDHEIQDLNDAVIDAETLSEATDDQENTVSEGLQVAREFENLDEPVQNSNSEKIVTPHNTTSLKTANDSLFEPYHTIDYFASQGIRLKEEKLGEDVLGKQVKTFTQWLRSMKKIYVEEERQLEKKEEEKVIKIADHSNKDEIILTETMAQIYIQQGKKSKAAEVYRKLSLLHPEKSSYFASLIENLNEVK